MGYKNTSKNNENEENLQEVMLAPQNNEFNSIRSAVLYLKVVKSTLGDRLAGAKSRSDANVKKLDLTRWNIVKGFSINSSSYI